MLVLVLVLGMLVLVLVLGMLVLVLVLVLGAGASNASDRKGLSAGKLVARTKLDGLPASIECNPDFSPHERNDEHWQQ